jgi:uncharacterized protein (TIGR00725 family)
MKRKLQIGVIGYAGPQEYPKGKAPKRGVYKIAEEVGSRLAKQGAIVITGGKSGVMEAAARGAQKLGGITLGVVKGNKRFLSNRFTDVEVLTGMAADGFDEFVLVTMCDVFIVIGGGAGTLEEIAIAYRNKKPIIAIGDTGGWADKLMGTFLDERETGLILVAKNAKDAVSQALRLAR